MASGSDERACVSVREGAAVNNNQWFSKIAVWLVVALVLFTVFKQFDRSAAGGSQVGYSDFLEEVRAKRIKSVTLQEGGGGTEILAVTIDDKRVRSTSLWAYKAVSKRLAACRASTPVWG